MAETFVGVDWSGESWLAVGFDRDGYDHTALFDEIGKLWQRYEGTSPRIFVHMPIGLIEEGNSTRECDQQAKAVLGPRSRSVLTPPVREATRKRRYPAAKRVNKRRADEELSKQAFAISDQIAAIDDLVRNVPEAAAAIRESHPEVCFRAFAGEQLQYSKKIAGGYAERMATLAGYDADAPPVVQSVAAATGDARVAVDDVLDAVVLAYTAAPGTGELRSLPADPPTDRKGIPVEIVYRSGTPLSP